MLNKERKKQIKFEALKCLERLSLVERALPIRVNKIPKTFGNCMLMRYSYFMKIHGLSYAELIQYTETYDACTYYYKSDNNYLILYNDLDVMRMESNRYRWSIAHELGHIVLNHLIDYNHTKIFRSSISEALYNELEEEADCFAAYLLVPHVALYEYNIKSQRELMGLCKISGQASGTRYGNYCKWISTNYTPLNWDDYDKQLYATYKVVQARKRCPNCNYALHDNHATYCPICGEKLEFTLEENMAKYTGIRTNENNRPIECPNCKNEDITNDSEYCIICGEYLFNVCSNEICVCSKSPLPGNARYCPCCGNETKYLSNGYLEKCEHDINDKRMLEDETPFQTDYDGIPIFPF